MPTTYAAALLTRACHELIVRIGADDIGPDDDRFSTTLVAVADVFGVSIDELETEFLRMMDERRQEQELESFDSADDEPVDDDEPTYGPARLRDDGYYAKNDAGEYAWM